MIKIKILKYECLKLYLQYFSTYYNWMIYSGAIIKFVTSESV